MVSEFFGFVDLILPTMMLSRGKLLFSLFPDTLMLGIFWIMYFLSIPPL